MQIKDPVSQQSILADQFFYFFLRLRKQRIRKVVDALNARYPEDTPEQKARRLIEAQIPLSFLGGTLMHLPRVFPVPHLTFEFLGFVGGTSALTRMHLYLILEIALLYGKDIDDEARVPEMVSVVAATGLAAGASLLAGAANVLMPIPLGGITASIAARMIGDEAVRYYSSRQVESPKGETAA